MSTNIKPIFVLAGILFACLCSGLDALAQDVEINIKIGSSDKESIKVAGFVKEEKLKNRRNWVFVNNYADAKNLAGRVKNLKLFNKTGDVVTVKKFAYGEFLASASVAKFEYEFNASVLEDINSTAHVSWLSSALGLLMLNDLLPIFGYAVKSAKITFDIPKDWAISTSEKKVGKKTFLVNDITNAVFLLGKGWREKKSLLGKTKINFVISGTWGFQDAEALEMASTILAEYRRIFGGVPFDSFNVFLIPFPKRIGFDRWRAESRGANVTILSSPTTFKSQATQRLHEQLRHEIFHLWIPNSLKLVGEYSWFYEGFAIYQALKTGVWLGQIRFEDFLATIGQAYNLDRQRERKFSLLEASKIRWDGSNSSVYAKGLLVAFMMDVALLRQSKGKRNLTEVFHDIYTLHNKTIAKSDANRSVVKVLAKRNAISLVIEKYVKGKDKINLDSYLETIGVGITISGSGVNFRVNDKLSRREKAYLKNLGYTRWRKFIRKRR